eukprot:CAMPEP_0203995948 /NCGR_PEP_ID=MMETSP0360-20130528/12418_1 /ASSEMBLY_ACC=CAM_ASM_000342 /TAXON_ID=268821 /ORGANISM="Scrippsiella Hangoei, Strain SHTV-5" /LENGTH=131 /DNA_ID=CAMNT_0050936707 /DNA_START=156 /DNA_END=552 /DNA_ORIENTATION=-
MEQITINPDSFDIDTFELPQSVNDNALYREKFLERIRVHQEWVKIGGPSTGEFSPALSAGFSLDGKKTAAPGLVSAPLGGLTPVDPSPPMPGPPQVRIKVSLNVSQRRVPSSLVDLHVGAPSIIGSDCLSH